MQSFRRLIVWEKAHTLALQVRAATRSFPRRGYATLISQILRSAESIPSNIVEGCGSAGPREFARYLDIAIKSSCELEYQLELARDCGVLPESTWRLRTADAVEIRRMLCGLRRKVLLPDWEPSPKTVD